MAAEFAVHNGGGDFRAHAAGTSGAPVSLEMYEAGCDAPASEITVFTANDAVARELAAAMNAVFARHGRLKREGA